MKFLSELTTHSKPWLLLALSALALEFCALYFQYALNLAPCIMCVYQRAAICAIILAGVIGFTGANFLLIRIFAYALWGHWCHLGIINCIRTCRNSGKFRIFIF